MAKPNPNPPPPPVSFEVERNVSIRIQPSVVLSALRTYLATAWPGGHASVPEDASRVTIEARVANAEEGNDRVECITLTWTEQE